MKQDVSIVIVNWNSGSQLQNCLDSVLACRDEVELNVVVVDNASSDGSAEVVKTCDVALLLKAMENLGFAKACNLGAKKTDSEFILFLNPDACLYKGTLEAAIGFMCKPENRHVGVCGVQLLDKQGSVSRHCTKFPTLSHFLAHSVGISRLFPNTGYVLSGWEHAETQEVDHVIGAFYFVRRQLFEELNGFDERFFMYMEDLDFSYRAHQKGWKSYYLVSARAFHAGGGTSNQVKAKRLYYSLRSRLLYAFKHLPFCQAWVLVGSTCLVEPLTRVLSCFVKRQWCALSEVYSAYRQLFTELPADFRRYWRN